MLSYKLEFVSVVVHGISRVRFSLKNMFTENYKKNIVSENLKHFIEWSYLLRIQFFYYIVNNIIV